MGPLDLIRPAGDRLRRAAITLLLVAATLVAELLDALAAGAVAGPGLAGSEILAGFGGLTAAAVIGLRVGSGGDPSRRPDGVGGRAPGAAPRGARSAGRPGTIAGVGGPRPAGALTAGLAVALVVHETLALLLHAEHGLRGADLAGHVVGFVVPVALVLGAGMALVVGTRVVRAAATARGLLAAAPGVPRAVARFVVAPTGDVVPARLLPALRLAGRAPPALAG